MRAHLLAILALVTVFWSTLAPPVDYDLWYDIRLGEEIAQTHSIPHNASFLATAQQTGPYYTPDPEWGFSLAAYAIYQLGGMGALAVAKSLLLTALFGVLWSSCRRVGAPAWCCVVWLYLGYHLMSSRFMFRPQLVTDLMLALLIRALLEAERGALRRAWPALPFFCLWANLHAGFAAGLTVLGLYTAAEWLRAPALPARGPAEKPPFTSRPDPVLTTFGVDSGVSPESTRIFGRSSSRPWWELPRTAPGASARVTLTWLGLGVVGSLITPGGWRLYYYVIEHFSARSGDMDLIAEWSPAPPGWYSGPLGLFTGLTLVGFALSLRVGQLRLPHPALFGFLLLSTLGRFRGIGELGAVVLPLAAAGWARLASPRRWLDGLAAAALLVCLSRSGWPSLEPQGVYPDKALQDLTRRGYRGAIFNAYHFGGWLVFKHYPAFIHGMTSTYPPPLLDEYLDILRDPTHSELLLEHYQVGAILLDYTAFNDIHTAFMQRLQKDPRWTLVYWDDLCLLFLPSPQKAPYLAVQPALADPFVGSLEEAGLELQRKLEQDPDCQTAWRLQAELRLRQKDEKGAEETYRAMETRFPGESAPYLGLGALYYHQGRLEPAAQAFRQAVRLATRSGTALINLALALRDEAKQAAARGDQQEGRRLWEEARQAAREALRQQPDLPGVQQLNRELGG